MVAGKHTVYCGLYRLRGGSGLEGHGFLSFQEATANNNDKCMIIGVRAVGELRWLQGLLESSRLHVQWQGTGARDEDGQNWWCVHT